MKRTTLLLVAVFLVLSASACQPGVRQQVATPAPAAAPAPAAPALPDGVTLVEAAGRKPGDEVFIPYRKYRLSVIVSATTSKIYIYKCLKKWRSLKVFWRGMSRVPVIAGFADFEICDQS